MASLGLAYLDSSDSDPSSDCEIVPESPPGLPITESPSPALPSTESPSPALPSTETLSETFTFPIPPIGSEYSTPEEGLAAINTLGRTHGYAVSSIRTKFTKKGVKKTIRLRCDRGHVPRDRPNDSPERKRQTTILQNECPFGVSLRLNQTTSTWFLTVENVSHNHRPSPTSTHPVQRSNELSTIQADIQKHFKQGVPTRQILTSIRNENPDSYIIPRDIYNFRRKVHIESLAGRTPLQALLIELPKNGDWIFRYEVDDDNHVTTLFCIHKSGVTMLKSNP